MAMHGVSLSIGSTDPLNWEYLTQLKQLAERVKPVWISDHLCWTGVNHHNTDDLLLLAYTQEAIQHVVRRVREVQDFLGCQFFRKCFSYLTFKQSGIYGVGFSRAPLQKQQIAVFVGHQ